MKGYSTVEDWCLSGMTQEDFIITRPFVRAESFDDEERREIEEIGEEIEGEIEIYNEENEDEERDSEDEEIGAEDEESSSW